jgi:hypothetical protein
VRVVLADRPLRKRSADEVYDETLSTPLDTRPESGEDEDGTEPADSERE